jgi:predicted LPLAT superfamily acyltransferase
MSVLWDSLISAGAGILGAVIGVLGALLASRRASRTAFEQVRYAVEHQRKAEVMTTAYDLVGTTRDKLLLLASERSPDAVARRSEEFLNSGADASGYLNRNAVWNDLEVHQALSSVQEKLTSLWVEFQQCRMDDSKTSEERERASDDLYEKMTTGKVGMEITWQLVAIGKLIQRKLALDDPPRGQ